MRHRPLIISFTACIGFSLACMSGEPEPFDTVCQMETTGLPFSKIIFAPTKGEILYLLDGAALRMPVQIASQEGDKLVYNFVWTTDEGTQTYAGVVTRESDSWTFETDGVKGGICKPVPGIEDVYKTVEELGIASGDVINQNGRSAVGFPASGNQQYMLDEGKGPRVYTYRVIGRQDGGVLIAETATPLSDSKSISMSTNSFTPMGDMLVEVSFPGQSNEMRRTYVPRTAGGAAPIAAPEPEPEPALEPVSVTKSGVEWVLDGRVALSVSIDKVTCSSAAGSRYCDIVWNAERGLLGTVWAKVYDGDGVKQKDTVGIGSVDAQGLTPGEKFKTKLMIESTTKKVDLYYR